MNKSFEYLERRTAVKHHQCGNLDHGRLCFQNSLGPVMVQERDPHIDTRTCMLLLSSAGLSLIYVYRIMLEKPLYYIDSRYERLGGSNSVMLLKLYIVR